uniref:Uncharacterized protein n=1 Tax=Romanomermis culicivorax TaxID=13658 RepID=A0A915I8S4_ROMCU
MPKDCGAVADGKGDASMMLTSSLMACSISPKALATIVGELVATATGGCWEITDCIWTFFVVIGGKAATTSAGWRSD